MTHARRSRVDDYDADEHFTPDEVFPGERLGAPLRRSRLKIVLVILVISLATAGGSWMFLVDRKDWPDWLSAAVQAVSPSAIINALDVAAPKRLVGPGSQSAAFVPPPPLPPIVSEPAPPAAASQGAMAPPPAAAEDPDAPPGPLPPPTVDPADPYQKRALAAGLHPGISRVVLAKLSAADYRNAAYAVKTALTETPDSGVLVWPRQREPDQALFQVGFVAGAASGCRRYVVKVAKDGWLTTALPMEKCGIEMVKVRKP